MTSLIEKVEAGSGNLRFDEAAAIANDLSPWETESEEWHLLVRALMGSIDAAVALMDQMPVRLTLASLAQDDSKAWNAEVRVGFLTSYKSAHLSGFNYKAPNGALALLSATLRAVLSTLESDQTKSNGGGDG